MIKITKQCKISKKELKLGILIEMEHTTSKKKAKHIAMQHLCEFPSYYSKGLVPMERRLKQLQQRNARPASKSNLVRMRATTFRKIKLTGEKK